MSKAIKNFLIFIEKYPDKISLDLPFGCDCNDVNCDVCPLDSKECTAELSTSDINWLKEHHPEFMI